MSLLLALALGFGCSGKSRVAISPDAGSAGDKADAAAGDQSSALCLSPTTRAVPLRRLTKFEYGNTVRDLLGDDTDPAFALPDDVRTFYADEQEVSTLLVESYHAVAHALAVKFTGGNYLNALVGCDPSTAGEQACLDNLVNTFVPRAFRRAPDPADAADFAAVFAKGRELGGDFASGVRAVVEVVLQSPEFLYRVEFGEPVDSALPTLARPTPYEMATRLSYLLWESMPDSALRDAAAAGKLRDKAEIAAQAQRLLDDPRARQVVPRVYAQLAPTGYPSDVSSDIGTLMARETDAFVEDVTWNGPGDFHALLTAPFTWLNAPLAQYYGVPGVTGDTFQRVSLDPARRGGLLTQGSVLTFASYSPRSNPIYRGVMVLRQWLCVDVKEEPANLPIPIPQPAPPDATTRQRFAQHSSDPACAECHRDIDGVGFAFEHFDGHGVWRDTESGQPIDASGELTKTDVRGTFNGAMELMQRVSRSQDAAACFVGHWLEYATARRETADDICSRNTLMNAFAQTKGNVLALLVALTQTDAFLYRPAPSAQP